jgi:hypothetical protein
MKDYERQADDERHGELLGSRNGDGAGNVSASLLGGARQGPRGRRCLPGGARIAVCQTFLVEGNEAFP